MTNNEYRALKRISNSDLSKITGQSLDVPQHVFDCGSAIHESILEPHLNTVYENVNYDLVRRLKDAFFENPFCEFVHQRSTKEEIVLWDRFGMPLKSKLDMIFGTDRSEVFDIKTTSASSEIAFKQTITEYNYDRQAAFYLDSIGAKMFTFIGLSKTRKTNPVFIVQATPKMIYNGRKEYEALLKYAINSNFRF